MNNYIGNPLQLRGAEHYTLHGGRGEGMNFLYIRNGLGLEPGNCNPDGRDVMRKNGTLRFLSPGEKGTTGLAFKFTDSMQDFEQAME